MFIIGFIALGFTIGGGFGPWLTGYIFGVTSNYRLAFLAVPFSVSSI